jgi:beta-fructofuranosidase
MFSKSFALAALLIARCVTAAAAEAPGKFELHDRTLVSWVSIEDLNCRGGSALSIGVGSLWDGIVFGERVPNKWMAGSEFWHRTPGMDELSKGENAVPNALTQIALVQSGSTAALFRDGKEIGSWKLQDEPVYYEKSAYVLFGLRHLGCSGTNAFLHGSIRDARIYDRPLSAEELAGLKPGKAGGPQPLAWWNFAKGDQDQMGFYNDCELKGKARIDAGRLQLGGAGDSLMCTHSRPGISRIQFRPQQGVFADPIPIYANGRYNIFYLRGGRPHVPWYHIVSDDLINWKEYPDPVITADGAPDSWDGGDMFTGSVIEHAGHFYCFYCGNNGGNPKGSEGIRLATSDDLIKWTKQPDFLVAPDGVIYNNERARDFRDAFPYKMPDRDEWWMILCAQTAAKKQVPGVYTSDNLEKWTAAQPLEADGQECPDLFKVGDTYYLIGGDHYSWSKDLRGPFTRPAQEYIDRPGIYAGKRMFDGKRNIWVGWIADTRNLVDGEKQEWGGTMCSPRELVPGPEGVLYVRPAKEVIDAFSKQVVDLKRASAHFDPALWSRDGSRLASKSAPARATFAIPAQGMLEMTLKMSGSAEVTVAFRTDDSGRQAGYLYTISPAGRTVVTHGQGIAWTRQGCAIDVSKPVTIRAILLGQAIEFFVNDQYAFTRTAFDLPDGKLGIEVTAGSVEIEDLKFKQLPSSGVVAKS